jgi:hypothetical protein
MPTQQPTISFQQIRNLTEKWTWKDQSGIQVTGFNVPEYARSTARQVPYFVKYVTGKGNYEQGEVITLKVDLRRHQRKVKFVKSNEIRIIRDYLIIEIDGFRVITH